MTDFERFIRFCIAGITNSSLNLLAMYFSLQAGIGLLYSSSIGFTTGACTGYIFNYRFSIRKEIF